MTTDAACRLVTYGTLSPGRSNHHELADVPGRWSRGHVRGELFEEGWGAAAGYPGIVLDDEAPPVEVDILESPALPGHWDRLDVFEGPGYVRVVVDVETDEGVVPAFIYALAPEPS